MNRDGRQDVVVVHDYRLGVFLQRPGGILAESLYGSVGSSLQVIGDLNGDSTGRRRHQLVSEYPQRPPPGSVGHFYYRRIRLDWPRFRTTVLGIRVRQRNDTRWWQAYSTQSPRSRSAPKAAVTMTFPE